MIIIIIIIVKIKIKLLKGKKRALKIILKKKN